jgi:hypothetical protein
VTSRSVTVAGYLVVLSAAVTLQVASRRERSGVPSLPAVLATAMRSRTGRVAVVAGWAWLGLHFFAR